MNNVLMITRAMIPSALLCGEAPLRELARQEKIVYRRSTPGKLRREDLAWADTVVFIRPDSPWEATAARMAVRGGKTAVCVLDDDLLNVPLKITSAAHYRRARTRRAVRESMEACQILVSPSPVLLERYGAGFAGTALIREPALPSPVPGKSRREELTVGFAGSADRTGDVDALLDTALRRVMSRHPDTLRLEFFGACPALAREGLARYIPYADDYEDYRCTMASRSWDIALAPMPDTPFHRCKYCSKFVEYASFGLAGIYSDAEVYRRAVRDGETGLLAANTPEAWENALERLLTDDPLRGRLAAGARREAETVYTLSAAAGDWEAALGLSGPQKKSGGLRGFALRKAAAGAEALFSRAKGIMEKRG